MKLLKLLNDLKKDGIELEIVNGSLRILVPKNKTLKEQFVKEIKEKKEEIIQFLINIDSFKPIKKTKKTKDNRYPVSNEQLRLWLIHQNIDKRYTYNVPIAHTIKGDLQKDILEKAFKLLIEQQEILRTKFEYFNGELYQKIENEVDFSMDYHDMSKSNKGQNYIKSFLNEAIYEEFNLEHAPLLKVNLVKIQKDEYVLIINVHHIIIDIQTVGLILDKVIEIYCLILEKKEIQNKSQINYKDYVSWKKSRLDSNEGKLAKEFWLNKLSGELSSIPLSPDNKRPNITSHGGSSVDKTFNDDNYKTVQAIMKKYNVTFFVAIQTLFNIFLSLYSNHQEIILGTPISERNHPELENSLGFYLNTIVLRNQIDTTLKFSDILMQIQESTLQSFEHKLYPFDQIVDDLNIITSKNRNPIFDIMIVATESGKQTVISTDAFTIEDYRVTKNTSKFDMIWFFELNKYSNQISVSVEYSTDIYHEETISELLNSFSIFINSINENGFDKEVYKYEFISKKQLEHLNKFNNTKKGYSGDSNVVELFKKEAIANPNKIALKEGNNSQTYKDLDLTSNQIANFLVKNKIKKGDVIGIMLPREIVFVDSLLGILKSGATFSPIDPDLPTERINYMLENANAKILITTTSLFKNEIDFKNKVVFIDDIKIQNQIKNEPNKELKININPDDNLYVIYTSGTTGNPKGVLLKHRNMINLIRFQDNETIIKFADSNVLQFAGQSFDVCYQEIFSSLTAGATLHLIDKDNRKDPVWTLDYIDKNNISIVFFPTAFIKAIGGDENLSTLLNKKIDHIIVAGEQLIISEFLKSSLKKNKIFLHNHYGPSETHVVTTLTIDPKKEISSIPTIGKPISNNRIYVLNNKQSILPIGTIGELYIAGENVGNGYINNEELTNQKFLVDPFYKNETMYKTGDLARWLSDGNIEYLGRIDFQVKIRGFRIELGEIENALIKYAGIKEAIVLSRDTSNGEKELLGYIVPTKKGKKLNIDEIKAYLTTTIPEYMIPSYLIQLENFKLNINGKIDRKVLPEPSQVEMLSRTKYQKPSTLIEKKLVKIWEEVLGIKKIGINDNFFELGGHSIKAIKVISMLYKNLNFKIALDTLFKNPTINSISKIVDSSDEPLNNVIKEYDI
jgi:amino acid adenylation domain-containing protein